MQDAGPTAGTKKKVSQEAEWRISTRHKEISASLLHKLIPLLSLERFSGVRKVPTRGGAKAAVSVGVIVMVTSILERYRSKISDRNANTQVAH
jgi:hypothetical protein